MSTYTVQVFNLFFIWNLTDYLSNLGSITVLEGPVFVLNNAMANMGHEVQHYIREYNEYCACHLLFIKLYSPPTGMKKQFCDEQYSFPLAKTTELRLKKNTCN